ncbi:motility associated factor glycosyltransferase family protein [Tumebacillus permanentifrigoris]|uniref:6-hydroxymethylpterin diphosphokinase MptE-like domain-containing protein n=1 Tax=Tumebacillus permanentifrigoris TaxID=378543 RepID=A0A316DD88_9BACL|nr:6-hydroxymethylpterin diphosphokinase MptE-like protein [Tumebacillus permanentifrigoris]PWK16181.1 hypothetical protein C7459_10142 [Tumebacillus permanentifrigoris]
MNLFEKNRQYLSEYNAPMFIEMEMEAASTADLEVLHVQDELIFKLTDDNGNEFYSASLYDPSAEADVFLDGVNFDNTGYIVMGLNSSAVIRKIYERKTETAWVFVIERDLNKIKKFLEEVDLSDCLGDKLERLVFFYGPSTSIKMNLTSFLYSLVGFYFLQTELLRTFPTFRQDKEYYGDLFEFLLEQIKLHVSNIGNSLEDTLLGVTNEFKNLKHILGNKQLKQFKDKYKGVPIICVASGPSLDKQLPLLRQAKGKSLIICAESAFRVLMKNGITPDIVCILERGTPSYEISLKGIEIPEETAFFGLSLVDSRIFEVWPKYKVPCFKQNVGNSRFLNEALGNFGELYTGSSVAHMNLSLAHYLGGSPIVLIGQDLAYSEDGNTHSKDTLYQDADAVEKELGPDRFKSIQDVFKAENEYNKTYYLDGYYGGQVKSRGLWRQFLRWMEHLVASTQAEVINATEGGVYIQGTVNMPFQEVLDTYCQDQLAPIGELFESLPDLEFDTHYYLERVYNRIYKHNQSLDGLKRFAEENQEMLMKLSQEVAAGNTEYLETKVSRVLRNTENLIKWSLEDEHFTFYFRPLIANLHVKTNPISRLTSLERLHEILKHQSYFMARMIDGAAEMIQTYEEEFEATILDLGYTLDEFELDEDSEAHEEEAHTEYMG